MVYTQWGKKAHEGATEEDAPLARCVVSGRISFISPKLGIEDGIEAGDFYIHTWQQ